MMGEAELEEVSEFLVFSRDDNAADHRWTHQNTLMFLELYKKYRDQVGSMRIKNLKKMFEQIAKEMQQLTKTHVTAANCENRWKVLERNYKKYIDNQNSTGRGRIFEYADAMHDILGKKKNIHPVLLLSADTIHTPLATSTSKNSESTNEAEMGYDEGSTKTEITESRPTPTICVETPASAKRKKTITPPSQNKRPKFHVLQETRRDRQNYYRRRLEIEEQKLVEKKRKNILEKYLEKNISIAQNFL